MDDMIKRQEAGDGFAGIRGMSRGLQVTGSEEWEETEAMLVSKIFTTTGHYFLLVITNERGQDDVEVLSELEIELGKKLDECDVEQVRVQKEHPNFPGSKYFDLVKVFVD